MKKVLKIFAIVLGICISVFVLWFANAFFGNPVSALLAQNALEDYLAQTYAGTDIVLEDVRYNFKTGGYYGLMQSQSSEDTSFYVDTDMWGHIGYDHYESLVQSRHNTYMRLEMQYRELTDRIFDDPSFPFESDICFGTLSFEKQEGKVEGYCFAGNMQELELDRQYDIDQLGAQTGELIVYVQDPEVSMQRAAEILLELKAIFDEAGVPFRGIDFQLQHPRGEDGTIVNDEAIFACLLYEQIYGEDLVQRVQNAHDQVSAYYAREDEQKLLEMGYTE